MLSDLLSSDKAVSYTGQWTISSERRFEMTGRLRYAAHAYAWTSSWSNDDLGMLARARDLGLDYVEIPLMEPDAVDAAAIRAAAAQADIGIVTSIAVTDHADPSSEDERIRAAATTLLNRCVDLTAEMGSILFSGVIYSAIGRRLDRSPDEGDYARSAAVLKDVARRAAAHGITIAIEPVNRYETFLVNTAAQALELVRMIDEPNVAVHLDTFHMNIEEDDFHDAVASVTGELAHFHLVESHMGMLGHGTVDWDGVFRALAEADYRGIVGFESFSDINAAIRAGTPIWRDLAPSSDALVVEGLRFLRMLEDRYYGESLATV
jgi:D-psicose/D-tagatose/L-ribulose 3-epimerase